MHDLAGNFFFRSAESQPFEVFKRFAQRRCRDLINAAPIGALPDEYIASLAPQPRAFTYRAGSPASQLPEFFAYDRRIGFTEAPLQVWDDTFERMASHYLAAALVGIRKCDFGLAGAVQN